MAATQFAADTPLLVTGLIPSPGIFALWQLWIYALAFLLMASCSPPAGGGPGCLDHGYQPERDFRATWLGYDPGEDRERRHRGLALHAG